MTTPSNHELKEAVKRFCRTDEAADNLVAYIEQYCDRVAREARIDELEAVRLQDWTTPGRYIRNRLAALQQPNERAKL